MTREAALNGLLGSLFSTAELRIFLGQLDPTLIAGIPEEGATPAVLVSASVRLLCRQGLIGPSLFENLEAARPRRVDEIREVMAWWSEGETESVNMRARRRYPQRRPDPPLRETNARSPCLPRIEHPFQGRVKEADWIESIVASTPSCAVVTGGPGIGKSTLALQVLHTESVAVRYGHNRWFVRIETSNSASDVERALVLTMGLPPESRSADLPKLIARGGASLVVLDNIEVPWEFDPEGCEALLARMSECPSLALILTVRGRVPPAGLALAQIFHLPPLHPSESKALFLAISSEHRTSPALDRLLQRTAHVPLAVVLLAKVALGNDLTNLLRAWEVHRTDILALYPKALDRKLSWKVSLEISWSSRRLTLPGRRLASICAALPDGVSVHHIESLGGVEGPAAATNLVHVGLAYFEAGRLRMLVPIREHIARHHPPGPSETTRITECYGYIVAHYRASASDNFRSPAALEVIAELNNVNAAIHIGLDGDDPSRWVRIANDLCSIVKFHGSIGMEPFTAALCTARQIENPAQVIRCLTSIGWIALAQHRWDDASAAYSEASALATNECNYTLFHCEFGLGRIAIARGDYGNASIHLDTALRLCRVHRFKLGEAHCVASLALLSRIRGELEAALSWYKQARLLYRSVGPLPGEASCLRHIAKLELLKARPDEAKRALRAAVSIYRTLGICPGRHAWCERELGDIAQRDGLQSKARRHFERALELFQQFGSARGIAVCRGRLENCDGLE